MLQTERERLRHTLGNLEADAVVTGAAGEEPFTEEKASGSETEPNNCLQTDGDFKRNIFAMTENVSEVDAILAPLKKDDHDTFDEASDFEAESWTVSENEGSVTGV